MRSSDFITKVRQTKKSHLAPALSAKILLRALYDLTRHNKAGGTRHQAVYVFRCLWVQISALKPSANRRKTLFRHRFVDTSCQHSCETMGQQRQANSLVRFSKICISLSNFFGVSLSMRSFITNLRNCPLTFLMWQQFFRWRSFYSFLKCVIDIVLRKFTL